VTVGCGSPAARQPGRAAASRDRYAQAVIVVVGQPAYRQPSGTASGRAAGPAVGVARAAVAAGSAVQIVGRIGGDAPGDALLLDLARAGIGHAAILRDAGRPTPIERVHADEAGSAEAEAGATLLSLDQGDAAAPGSMREPVAADAGDAPELDPADLELGLRYLTGYGVVVAAEPLAGATLAIVAEAAAFAGAQLVVVTAPGSPRSVLDASVAVTLLEAPPDDPDGQFAALVGRYAAALDAGVAADAAFRDALGAVGWEPVSPSTSRST